MAFGAKIKLTPDTSNKSEFRSKIQKHVDESTSGNPIKLKKFEISLTKAEQSKLISELQTYLSADKTLTIKVGKIDATDAVNDLRKQLKVMLSGLKITGLKEFLGNGDIGNSIDASMFQAQLKVVESIQSKLASTFKSSISGTKMLENTNDIEHFTSEYKKWQYDVEMFRASERALSEDEIKVLQKKGIEIQRNITLRQKEASATTSAAKREASASIQQAKLIKQINQYIKSNSNAYKYFGKDLNSMLTELQSSSNLSKERLDEIAKEFTHIQSEAKRTDKAGNTFFDTMRKGFEKFGGWSLVTRSLMAVYRTFKNMVVAVKEVDMAMTELRKVTDLSEMSYAKFLETAKKISTTLGSTLPDTINATADFARLGYGMKDATALAEAALVYKNVGDGIKDIGTASESLISTIKAFEQFGESADDAMGIIDRFNEVGNNFAISSNGIGEALRRSASSLAAAGNNLNESIALVTGMNAVVQDPEKVGTALKSVSMFLRAAKTEAEEAGESTEGMANSVSELRDELLKLTNGKIDIMLDENSFKSTYQIMKELSKVWSSLSDIDTANILELIGGKRNANAVTSLLTNFDDAEAALKTAMGASGSALAENEKYLDSITGKLEILKAKFEAFATDLISSDIVKTIVDIGSALVSVLDFLQRIHLLLPLIAASVMAIKGLKNVESAKGVATMAILQKGSLLEEKKATDALTTAIGALTKQEKKALVVQLQRRVASGEIKEEEYKQIISTLGLEAAEKGLITTEGKLVFANKTLAGSFKSLMASIPIWGWIALAVTVVIEAVTVLTQHLGEVNQKAIDGANEIIDAYSEANDTFSSNKKSLEDMRDEFDSLSQGVDENGKNVSLTAEEYKTFLSLIDQIVKISPDVCSGYDKEGKAILNYKTALDEAIASQETYIKNQRNIYLGSGKEVFDGKNEEYKKAKKDLHNASGTRVIGDDSLESVLSPQRTTTPVTGYDDYIKKLKVLEDAFRDLNIQLDLREPGAFREDTESVLKIYENAEKLMVYLRNSGAYTEEELTKIQTGINGLSSAYSQMSLIEQEQVNYLSEWAKDQTWYKSIPTDAIDEFIDGLKNVNDPLEDYKFNINSAANYGSEFSKSFNSDGFSKMKDMASGLTNNKDAIENYNKALEDFKTTYQGDKNVLDALLAFLDELSTISLGKNSESGLTSYTKALSDLPKETEKFEKAYSVLTSAQEDMASGGLSSSTIKSIIDLMGETENYIDYLVVENGQIKLNTEAWKKRADAMMLGDFDKLKQEQKSISEEYLNGKISLSEYNKKIEENQKLLALYKGLYDKTTGNLDTISGLDTLQGGFDKLAKIYNDVKDKGIFDFGALVDKDFVAQFGNLSSYENFLKVVANSPTDLATCQEAFNKLTMEYLLNSEALKNVTVESRNVAIALLEQSGVSNASLLIDTMLVNRDAELSAAVLNVTKATKDETVAFLEQNGVANAAAIVDRQLAIEKEKVRLTSEGVADAGADEIIRLYEAAEAGSVEAAALQSLLREKVKVNQTTIQTSGDIQNLYNLAKAANASAESIANLSEALRYKSLAMSYEARISSADGRMKQFYASQASHFYKVAGEFASKEITFDDIAGFEGLSGGSFNYSPSVSSSSGSGSSKSDKTETWFEKQYKEHKHLVEMEQETESDYLTWLNKAYKQAYSENIIELDDYNKYQEEVYNGLRDLYKDYLNDIEHEISMRENYDGESKKIISLYKTLISSIEKEIEKARSQGLGNTSDYIQELQSKWQDYSNSIKEIEEEALQNAKDALDELVEYRMDMLKEDVDTEKNALDKKLDNLKEFYDKQKEMLQDQHDEEEYLKEQSEKRKSVSDLQSELAMLSRDNSAWAQRRKLELQEELSKAQEDLNEFEDDHALELALDALDNAYNAQEAQLQAEMDALDERLNDPEALYNKALNDIKTNTGKLYSEMLEYNRRHGTGNDDDVKETYEEAYKALLEYKQLNGKDYEGVILTNATDYKQYLGGQNATVSGIKKEESPSSNTGSTGTSTSALAVGSTVRFKDSATNYGSKSNGSPISAWAKKQSFTIGEIDQQSGQAKLLSGGTVIGWVNLSDITAGTATGTTPTVSPPPLTKGSKVTIKTSATHYGSKSNGKKMASFVPGSEYTVSDIDSNKNEVLVSSNGTYIGWIKKSDIVGYARGTSNATAGIHRVDELGAEALFTSKDGTKYRFLNAGDKVLTAHQTDFLYNLAKNGESIMAKIFSYNNVPTNAIRRGDMSPVINMGDIIIQGNANEKTVSEIRREQREQLNRTLREFNKLSKCY